MSVSYNFLQDCQVFYVLTVENGCPCGRPFGAVMEYKGDLYISTDTSKAVYRQMVANPNVQLLALKNGTRNWVRISGKAFECADLTVKQKMLENCPVLTRHYSSADYPSFAVFKITDKHAHLSTNDGVSEID